MQRLFFFVVLIFSFVALSAFAKEKAAPANPVQKEMQLLQAAMQSAVAAIAVGDVRALPRQFHQVHLAAEKTKKATGGGAYKPPRNADRLARFRELDEAFHKEMIKLVKAAKKNDVDTTAAQLGVLIGRCNGCHVEFRGPMKAR